MPFKFTGKIDKLTITVEPPKLTAEDEKRLKEAEAKAERRPVTARQASRDLGTVRGAAPHGPIPAEAPGFASSRRGGYALRALLIGAPAMRATLLSVVLTLSALPALAAGDPDAVKGLLADHCSACHDIPVAGAKQPATGLPAPPFTVIANDPDAYPDARLRTFLQKPHWPMTGFTLSPIDIDNILAYLATLRHR